jgi:hypothetical protein
VLSVHDSFIAPRRAEPDLRQAMEKAFLETRENMTVHVKTKKFAS